MYVTNEAFMDIDYVNNDSVIHVYHDEEAKLKKLCKLKKLRLKHDLPE
jgi:hypothetical protein